MKPRSSLPFCVLAVAVAALVSCGGESRDLRWWKGNLHTHSLWSDGDDYPEAIVGWYKDQGYDFLALSDHNTLAEGDRWIDVAASAGGMAAFEDYVEKFGTDWVEQRQDNGTLLARLKTLEEYRGLFEEVGSFLLIQSEEITDRFESKPIHVNATNIAELIEPQCGGSVREVMQNNVDAVLDQRRRTGQAMFPRYAAATDEQLTVMLQLARQGLNGGAVGIGFGVQYVPGASREEVLRLFELCAEFDVPCHLHVRYLGPHPGDNSSLAAIEEVIAAAAVTGASAQIVHIGSVAGRKIETALWMLEGAQARGIDVMADVYPYTAVSTGLSSTVFDEGWQERMGGISYGDIELTRTGERLTAETFASYRAERTHSVIVHFIPEESVRRALAHPLVMVASDGVIRGGRGHPRGAGTFSRVLGRYVREQAVLSLPEAIRKMTIMPARRLEQSVPAMIRKGRLNPGADADVVVFDPATVADRATYREPAQHSAGIRYVLVNGQIVVEDGKLNPDVQPGRPVRRGMW